MPTYDFYCPSKHCGWFGERVVPIAERNRQDCPRCPEVLYRRPAAPLFKIMGRVTPGGGPDKFTADMLGIPLHDLPDGLKTTS